MGVYLQKRGEGYEARWRGSWTVDGKRKFTLLNPWRGTPPQDGGKFGDAAFERSRGEAERLLARIRDGERSEEEEVVLSKRIYAARYGGDVGRIRISELAKRWDALPHKADLTEERRERVHSVLGRFESFMKERFPRVTEAGALTAEHFKAFLAAIDESGVSARSWNDYLSILRGVLGKVDGQGAGFRDYLSKLPKRAENTIHRRPFTGEELEEIFTAARKVDPELYPVIVAAACTALRRGDVCKMRWDSIDLADGFATVKTTKTGENVVIPIFPPFMGVLQEAARKRRKGVPYVFPGIALAYKRNADWLNGRLRRVLAAAGFDSPDKTRGGKYPEAESPLKAVCKVDEGMRRDEWDEEQRTMGLAILQRHLNGESGEAIAEELEIGEDTVSDYLHAMEDAGEVALFKEEEDAKKPILAAIGEEQRKQRGSLCGWHSFRTTFCTLALANGVPMEILRKITGHRTAEIVLKHYDRRGREETRKVFGAAMPKAIAGAVERKDADFEFVAMPPKLAALLNQATAEQLAEVEKMLADAGTQKNSRKRGGGKKP